MWAPPPPPPPPHASMDTMRFPKPNNKKQGFVSKQRNWKGKKGRNDARKDGRRKEKPATVTGVGGGGSKPPTVNELQYMNRLKARRFYPNNNNNKKKKKDRFAPYAPLNTTSFIIRAKKSGGIAAFVSPSPVTPAVLPTPNFSPSREVLGDMAKEEWGVDGYGSMKGLIRLRSSPGNEGDGHEEEEEEEEEGGGGSSESDVEEHVEVERRLDHDLSRFEMVCPNYGVDYNNLLESRVEDQDTHIGQLEEENLILKERVFLMERELGDLRRRLVCLERQNQVREINEGVVDNASENESEGKQDISSREENNDNEEVEENSEEGREFDLKKVNNEEMRENEFARDDYMEESVHVEH